jgi:hypothetical protein
MSNISVGAGAASRYGSDTSKNDAQLELRAILAN